MTGDISPAEGSRDADPGTWPSMAGPVAASSRRRTVNDACLVLLPVGLVQRILHVPELIALNRVRPGLMEGPHQSQARLLHHPPRGLVDSHRLRDHALDTQLGEALTDQRARPLGDIPLAPR